MIFTVTFKTPDAVRRVVEPMVEAALREEGKWDKYEWEEQVEETCKMFDRWVEYGECVTVDFDLDAETATVRERK